MLRERLPFTWGKAFAKRNRRKTRRSSCCTWPSPWSSYYHVRALEVVQEWITIGWLVDFLFASVKTRTPPRYTETLCGRLFFDRYDTESGVQRALCHVCRGHRGPRRTLAVLANGTPPSLKALAAHHHRREFAGVIALTLEASLRTISIASCFVAGATTIAFIRTCRSNVGPTLSRDLAHLRRNPDGRRFNFSVRTLAGADSDCIHHRKSFPHHVYLGGSSPDRQLYCGAWCRREFRSSINATGSKFQKRAPDKTAEDGTGVRPGNLGRERK